MGKEEKKQQEKWWWREEKEKKMGKFDTLLIRKVCVHKEEGTCTEILLTLLPTAEVNPGILQREMEDSWFLYDCLCKSINWNMLEVTGWIHCSEMTEWRVVQDFHYPLTLFKTHLLHFLLLAYRLKSFSRAPRRSEQQKVVQKNWKREQATVFPLATPSNLSFAFFKTNVTSKLWIFH